MPHVKKKPALESGRADFERFIVDNDHPCVMARSVFEGDRVSYHEYAGFGSRQTAALILEDLQKYLDDYNWESNDFKSFLAVFKEEQVLSEVAFEEKLWNQLQHLHDLDPYPWDERVSPDPENKNFSFSLLGKAFFLVGMHPQSSRKARQAPYPSIAFNLHWQFERLREMNAYEVVKNKIRENDIALQGDHNPMLADYGQRSEARQYSGRKVDNHWKCPFHNKKK